MKVKIKCVNTKELAKNMMDLCCKYRREKELRDFYNLAKLNGFLYPKCNCDK